MTEQTAPFGGLAVAEPQTAVLPVGSDDDGAPDNRRKLAIVGAAAGVVVLLVAVFFLLKGGGSDGAAAPVAPNVIPPAAAAGSDGSGSTGQAGTTDAPVKLPKSYSAPVGRDPFKAQYVAPVVHPPKETTGSSTGSEGTTSGDVPVTTVPGGTDTGVGTTNVPSSSFAPVWVELVSVKGVNSATFVVGYSDGHHAKTRTFSRVTAPTNGLRTTFAGVFALLSIQDGTVTLQFGDGTPFDLNKGFGSRHFVG